MAINMEYLAHFMVAAEHMNITVAAEKLFMSQSTLSRQIKSLETEFEVPLFNYDGRSISLTSAGKTLYDVGGSLLAHLDQVTNMVSDSSENIREKIDIYSVPAYPDELVDVYRNLQKRGINADFCIHHMRGENPLSPLISNAASFLIVYEPFMPNEPGYIQIPFHRSGFSLVCSESHHLAKRANVSFDECLRENILFGLDFPMSCYRGTFSMSRRDMPNGNIEMSLPSYYAPVKLNEGVLILPSVASFGFGPNLRYIPINEPLLDHDLVLVYKRSAFLSFAAHALVTEIMNVRNQDIYGPPQDL